VDVPYFEWLFGTWHLPFDLTTFWPHYVKWLAWRRRHHPW